MILVRTYLFKNNQSSFVYHYATMPSFARITREVLVIIALSVAMVLDVGRTLATIARQMQ